MSNGMFYHLVKLATSKTRRASVRCMSIVISGVWTQECSANLIDDKFHSFCAQSVTQMQSMGRTMHHSIFYIFLERVLIKFHTFTLRKQFLKELKTRARTTFEFRSKSNVSMLFSSPNYVYKWKMLDRPCR